MGFSIQGLQALFNPSMEFIMTTLSHIALDAVCNYDAATKQLAGAWRARTSRVVDAGNRRFASFVAARSIPLVSQDVKGCLIQAEMQIAGLVARAIDLPALGTEKAIGLWAKGLTRSIDFVAGKTSNIDSPVATRTLETLGKLALPGVQLANELASTISARAKRLNDGMSVVADQVAEPVEASQKADAAEPAESAKARAKAKTPAPAVVA
jgi:hypothetical protein